MTPPRLAGALVLLLALSLTACGGGTSSSTPSTATPSGAGSPSAEKFCTAFKDASAKFGSDNTFPTKAQTGELRAFADTIESAAPAEIKSAARGLADYFRSVADGVDKHGSNPSPDPSAVAEFGAALPEIDSWASTHCAA